jgi:3-dehydroquinate dehydratase
VGADEALTYFLSWYEKVNLETLRSVREGSAWTTDLEFIRHRKELAHSYMDYADIEVFVRDIREPKKKDDVEDAEGSESSQDEEETEEASNAGAKALDQGSDPAGGDGSIPSAGSGTPEADISTATAPPADGFAPAS